MPDFLLALIVKPIVLLIVIVPMALGVYLVRRFCSPRWQRLLLRKIW